MLVKMIRRPASVATLSLLAIAGMALAACA